jgi:hypothetical protein
MQPDRMWASSTIIGGHDDVVLGWLGRDETPGLDPDERLVTQPEDHRIGAHLAGHRQPERDRGCLTVVPLGVVHPCDIRRQVGELDGAGHDHDRPDATVDDVIDRVSHHPAPFEWCEQLVRGSRET